MKTAALDRRAALKARHRAAILGAARAMSAEDRAGGFGVDELAARADVARRTVFNHFGSIDGVRVALAEEALSRAIGELSASATAAVPGSTDSSGSGSAVVDDLVGVLQSADLPAAVVAIEQQLRDLDRARIDALTGEAVAHVSAALLDRLLEQRPGLDRLQAALLVHALLGGVVVIAEEWLRTTGGALDAGGRDAWRGLLALVVDGVRSGHRVD